MAGKVCVYVRDGQLPANLHDEQDLFFLTVREAGTARPLVWNGERYSWVPLPLKGVVGGIAGELSLPCGVYLMRASTAFEKPATHVAWVQVKDGETATVNLVPLSVVFDEGY